jgi:multidrug efflux pump subunit AcrB
VLSPAPRNARPHAARDVHQPRSRGLTAHPTPATLLPRANLDAKGGLDFLSAGDARAGFEWSGEWTITYETFRDLGLAFAAALVLIFILLVWELKNFIHPIIIMSPIPLTLIGIIPGHWLMEAEFTATSMIGLIALAGKTRMRPIWITDLTMMAGAVAILFAPIFEGMAISLLFGPIVAVPVPRAGG